MPALGLGGHVRKGEHGTTVVYADRFIPDDEKKRARETGEEAQAAGPRSPASMPGLLERLRGPGISGAVAPNGASARNLLVRYLAFLETTVLCLSVPIRGYDDPNFDIPSATLSLHLQSCEIVSASLWALVKHGTPRTSIPPELLTSRRTDAWNSFRTSIYFR